VCRVPLRPKHPSFPFKRGPALRRGAFHLRAVAVRSGGETIDDQETKLGQDCYIVRDGHVRLRLLLGRAGPALGTAPGDGESCESVPCPCARQSLIANKSSSKLRPPLRRVPRVGATGRSSIRLVSLTRARMTSLVQLGVWIIFADTALAALLRILRRGLVIAPAVALVSFH
jgi:hypothetical protein